MRYLGPLAAITLLIATPAMAQPPAEPEGFPAEMLAPDEDARQFFEAAAANPFSGEVFAELPPEAVAQLDVVLQQVLAPGEHVAGWPDVGIDLMQLAAAREGGAAASMADGASPVGVIRTYFGDRPLDSIIPLGWILVGAHGSDIESRDVYIDTGNISRKLILVLRVNYRKHGRMRCERRTQTRIYADPNVAASQADMGAFLMSLRLAMRLDGLGLCYGADEREPGAYVSRSFDSSGRRLPELDRAQPPLRIVPAAPMPAAPAPR